MSVEQKKLPLTNIQRAYLIGRTGSFELGGCSTHVYYEFINDLSPEKFDDALNEIVAEQPMLRAVINSEGEEIVLDTVPKYTSHVYDWSDKTQPQIDELIQNQRDKYSHEVMPSDTWPLFRFEFARLPSGKYYLFAGFDLLVVDAGSFALIAGELYNKYNNITDESEIGSFEKYLELIENRKTKSKYISDREFWEQTADDLPAAPLLPLLSRDNSQKNIFKRKQFFIDADTWSSTKDFLSAINVSPTVGVLSAYAAILGMWSNQERFTLNLPMTNLIRRKKIMNRVLGDFTEEMLLPLDRYMPNDDFKHYVEYVNAEFMKFFRHNYFDGIEVMSHIRSKTGETVKLPVVYTGMISDKNEFDNIDFFGNMVYGVSQTPQVTLDCQVFETHGRLKVVWDYIESLFDEDEINNMFEKYIQLISNIGADQCKVESILSIMDKHRKELAKYNCTFKEIPQLTLYDIFKRNVEKHSENIAVSDSKDSISYRKLDELSDCAAAYLVKKGVRKGDRVAVIGNRNLRTPINILGVIKAGGTYVPVNPQYPEERRRYIVENSNCVCVMDGSEELLSDVEFTAEKTVPSDIAYIIYTSGSTGTPKGVVIRHDSVCNTILDVNERFGVTSSDKLLCVSSFGFDLSVYDMFGALAAGAEMVIAEDNKNIKNICDILHNKGITLWNSVPSIMELVVDSLLDDHTEATLKNVLLSGDWIPVSLPDKIRMKFPNARIISLGGATEGSIWSIFYEIGSTKGLKSIPYGYPLGNQQMYVLDDLGNEIPYEVEGEICIGGRGVAEGYDNDPEKTSAAFIRHKSFGDIYHTGDFGVMKREGYMEFRGRRDQQVKIHGYRVELGEIESALGKLKNVQQATADISKNENGSYDISAYIVPKVITVDEEMPDMQILDSDIRNYMKNIEMDISAYDLEKLNTGLENISTYYMKKFFAENAGLTKAGDTISIDSFVSKNGIKTDYKALITEWLNELCADGYISFCDDVYTLESNFESTDENELWNALDRLKGVERISALKEYIHSCCTQHLGLFKGEIMPISLYFHDDNTDTAKNIYTDSPIAAYVNTAARKAVTEIIKRAAKKDKPFRILELGAGIGGTSAQLFEEIKDLNIDYEFSDISEYFLVNASERFEKYDFIKYSLLNINSDLQSQGCSYNSYDMILAVNVIHDAQCLDDTIEYIKTILRPQGHLVMIETTQNMRSQEVSLGFLEGLNPVYKDMRSESKKAFMNEKQWHRLFSEHGLRSYDYVCDSEMKNVVWQNLFIIQKASYAAVADESEMRDELKKLFPDYMIPSKIFMINEIPLTANGKVNKKKLPKLLCAKTGTLYEAPHGETEEKLTGIWQQALDRSRIGVNDNFFELGGDSLNAIKIVTMAERVGLYIELADLYKHSTIRELAKVAVFKENDTNKNELSDICEDLDENDLENILSQL